MLERLVSHEEVRQLDCITFEGLFQLNYSILSYLEWPHMAHIEQLSDLKQPVWVYEGQVLPD